MRRAELRRFVIGAAALLLPASASAHSFGRMYVLPVPIWMYLYGAAAALAVSFLVVGYFVTDRSAGRWFERRIELPRPRFAPPAAALRVAAVFLLLLTIATGLFGNPNPYLNLSMTLFWIGFVLAFAYLTAVVGDVYAAANPWRVLCDGLERLRPGLFRGRREYPRALGDWAALGLYMAFIWFELFGHSTPRSLALALLAYTAVNFSGAWWFGKEAWFQHGEFFAVFFRLLGKIAPIARAPDGGLRLRHPFAGLLEGRAQSMSELLFVLFMLASTAFDGIRDTRPWVTLFWQDLYIPLLRPLMDNPAAAYPLLLKLYLAWQSLALMLAPFFYLALYVLFVGLSKLIVRSPLPLRELLLRFGYTLIPIALVYNVTHYFTLLIVQGAQLPRLLSDPFGFGWNLLGGSMLIRNYVVDAGTVWNVQVGLILFGHIVSVVLAHIEALRTFPSRRAAVLSQIPMLLLMVAFTSLGLWILSLPLAPTPAG